MNAPASNTADAHLYLLCGSLVIARSRPTRQRTALATALATSPSRRTNPIRWTLHSITETSAEILNTWEENLPRDTLIHATCRCTATNWTLWFRFRFRLQCWPMLRRGSPTKPMASCIYRSNPPAVLFALLCIAAIQTSENAPAGELLATELWRGARAIWSFWTEITSL